MYQGQKDTLEWFRRTKKKGWRLTAGRDTIAEYFDDEGSPESAADALETELDYLRGGKYHIDAKDAPDVTRKILSTDFTLMPRSNEQPSQAVAGTRHDSAPMGFISAADVDKKISEEIQRRELIAKNKELQQTILQMQNAPAEKVGFIDQIMSYPGVADAMPMLIQAMVGKLFAGAATPPMQYQQGIAGKLPNVPPVVKDPAQPSTEAETEEGDDLTDEQDDRLTAAFFDLADQVGSVEETIELLECMTPFIQENRGMYDNMILPQLNKYKKQ